MGAPMARLDTERWISRQNVERYKKLLVAEHDDVKRQQIMRLIALEQEKLNQLDKSA